MVPSRSLGLLLILLLSAPLLASTYVVNDLGDAGDQSAGNDICATAGAVCTLRAAIEEANAHAGADVITFSVAGTIAPATPLPAIAEQLEIDATTAPGYVGAPVVAVQGGGSIATGFDLVAGSSLSELHGLKVHGFTSAAISIASANVLVRRNHLGPVGGGTANQQGAVLLPSSSACTIGGATDGDGNVISGNTADGLVIDGTDHLVADNFIGTNATGTAALPNGLSGIALLEDATNVSIGAVGTGIENVVSGNGRDGINAFRTVNMTIINNVIGLNAAGHAAIPTGREGILDTGGSASTIGTPTAGNVISGNGGRGLEVNGGTALVRNNIVGLDRTGQIAIGNVAGGILASGPITIGGSGAGEGNTVSGNLQEGIGVNVSGTGTRIYGNTVGLNIDRTGARGNTGPGIYLGEAFFPDDLIIGAVGSGRNVISGNGGSGIAGAATNSVIVGNYIGTDGTGTIDLGNGGGIAVFFVDEISSNLISGNGFWGIHVSVVSNVHDNVIRRNALGGVGVANDSTTAVITENSIFANGGIGIDLRADGVTANDPADADAGPNGLQNFPVITSAVTTGTASWIAGTLNSTPNTLFSLHFYNNTAPDPSGYGEGETYVGTIDVNTDAAGNASFVRNGGPLASGWLTATATGPSGTSEFSAVNDVAAAPAIHFSQAAYTTHETEGVVTITVVREGDLSGTSTVDYATSDDTATAGTDYTPASGTLTFAPGQSSATFNVTILSDGVSEMTERFNVALSNPNAATLTLPSNAVVAIAAPIEVPTVSMLGLLALMSALGAFAMMKMR
jgi:CSLREA domain-containing protein